MMRIGFCFLIVGALLVAGCKKEDGGAPKTETAGAKTVTTASGVEMVQVPGGSFMMGSENGEEDEKPVHQVTVSGFLMDRCEVTQKSYEGLMGKNPSKFVDPQKPVERTSWVSAITYCNMRSSKEGLKPCYDLKTGEGDCAANGYRLPTEAEWEYACRAGTTGAYSFGDNAAELSGRAWMKTNSNQMTHAAGQKQANAWGIFDMHGNVAEWCNDRYGEKEYAAKVGENPHGPAKGDQRVLRGGCWKDAADGCRSSARSSESPGLADACFGSERYGFRCVRNAP